jgi:hypothetical protein
MGRHIVFEIIVAEFERALAAAQRYENLRYGRACHEVLPVADIPRRIFEEFYAFPDGFGTRSDSSAPFFPHTGAARVPASANHQHAIHATAKALRPCLAVTPASRETAVPRSASSARALT